jgi:methionyl-tRNA formyltransferase
MKTIFLGSSSYVLPIIEILNHEFGLKLVVTTEQKETDAVPKYCLEQKIPYLSVTTVKNEAFIEELKGLHCPVAVLADFGLMIPTEVTNIFPKGIVNIHPSLLPKYRGSTPGQAAILQNEHETGVSIMLLDKQLDHGPILAQEKAVIEPTDTANTLYTRLFTIGSPLLVKSLHSYLDGSLTPIPQDDSDATYTKQLTKQDGFVDINSPEMKIENLPLKIRAFFPWPGVWTKMNLYDKEKIVKFLPNNMLQVEGKKPMTVKDFLNGYPDTAELLKKLTLL